MENGNKMTMLKHYKDNPYLEVGIDEAGRGAVAGPLFAASVCLGDFKHPGIKDSKQLTTSRINDLARIIKENALAYHVSMVPAIQIDKMGINPANLWAMKESFIEVIKKINGKEEMVALVDGVLKIDVVNKQHTIKKGDSKYMSIAAASILAKSERDAYMENLDSIYENYEFSHHVGYLTKRHKDIISKLGTTAEHRLTFKIK